MHLQDPSLGQPLGYEINTNGNPGSGSSTPISNVAGTTTAGERENISVWCVNK